MVFLLDCLVASVFALPYFVEGALESFDFLLHGGALLGLAAQLLLYGGRLGERGLVLLLGHVDLLLYFCGYTTWLLDRLL